MLAKDGLQCSSKACKIYCIKISREFVSVDIETTRAFTAEFMKVIEDTNFPLEFVLNEDETGLYWKKCPPRRYISREEISAPGFKASKDRLTLLLGGNASETPILPWCW